ncbi:hypothetical protein [Membranihabitans maritimus]|uniref:hypothetical protein n=1 Tax=Membranihabitans maritimus TaxID=2904244 RepID=UPI001F40B8D1|nr:hypothetical protein [Membranihabitans maritimus]
MDGSRNIPGKRNEVPGRIVAMIAYLTIIGLMIAFVINYNSMTKFATYHIRQAIGLTITAIVLTLIGLLPLSTPILCITGGGIILCMWFTGLVNAFLGKEKPLPLLGSAYNKWLKGL